MMPVNVAATAIVVVFGAMTLFSNMNHAAAPPHRESGRAKLPHWLG
jgi:hypothetical protein